MLAETF